jgi:hypothetical protein
MKSLAEILIEKYYLELQYSNEAAIYIQFRKKDILKLSRLLYVVHYIGYSFTVTILKTFNNANLPYVHITIHPQVSL